MEIEMVPVILVLLEVDGASVAKRDSSKLPKPLYDTVMSREVAQFDCEDNGVRYTLRRVDKDEDPPHLYMVPVVGGTPLQTH